MARNNRLPVALGILASILIAPTVTRADDIVNTCNTGGLNTMSPRSQGFTATMDHVGRIEVGLWDVNTHLNPSRWRVTFELFVGDATGTRVASITRDLAAGSAGLQAFDLGFLPVVRGSTYTFQVSFEGGRGAIDWCSGYAGGTSDSGADYRFTVREAFPCTVTDNADGSATLACGTRSFVVTDGVDGADGTSCSGTDNGDGTSTISCTDGTGFTVRDGEDGTSCTVTDNADGSATISCTDGTSYTVETPGDGTSCTVAENDDGSATISCTDGTSYTVRDGADGTPCTLAENDDGTATITCADGTSYVVQDGADGESCTIEEADGVSSLVCPDGTRYELPRATGGGGCSVTAGTAAPTPAWCAALLLAVGLVVRRRRRS